MSTTVRVAFEIEVEKAADIDVAVALDKAKDQILGFAADTIVPNDDKVEGAKITKLGAEVHLHKDDGDRCRACLSQADRQLFD